MDLVTLRATVSRHRGFRFVGETTGRRTAVLRYPTGPIARPDPDAPAPIPFEMRPENWISVNDQPVSFPAGTTISDVRPSVGPIAPAPGGSQMPGGFGFQNVPGSSGPSGNVWADIASAGIGLAGQIFANRAPQQTTVPLPRLPAIGQGGLIERGHIPGVTPLTRGHDVTLTRDGRPRRIRKDGRPWKVPRMNVTNSRALRRSMRRVQGFARLAKKTITFTQRVKMKKRRR